MKLQALIERAGICDNKQFLRLSEKTQVISPQNGLTEVIRNRMSHSHEVASSSYMMSHIIASKLGISYSDIDYMHSVENAGLLHDLGHSSFGHDGSELLNKLFKNRGLADGFSDNNNNITVIEKNGIDVRNYVLASIIKYPQKLYPDQKSKYYPMLKEALQADVEHYRSKGIHLKGQSCTIACQIMDEADRNSYVCSDMSDFISMGNTLNRQKLSEIAQNFNLSEEYSSEINKLLDVASKGKNLTKKYFSDLKVKFNSMFELTDKGIKCDNRELMAYREFLSKVSFECYITPIRKMPAHHENMAKLEAFVDHVIDNEFYPSSYYRSKIESATSETEKLTAIRDMVSEVSDWYIKNIVEELNLDYENNTGNVLSINY